ncbi:substrate-binding domain-containing protein [Streptomyces griseoluteus]|uniref:substrate-binding domain-containing protein n=1 Tax=Streptomyces griseoluteus TaxID=29306 RepID=UPI00381FDD4C
MRRHQDDQARRGHPCVPLAEGSSTPYTGASAIAALPAEHPDETGVFAATDLMTQGACQVPREHGRRVPDGTVVAGCDGFSAALSCRPPLTTVRQPVEEMAATTARLVDPHVRGGAEAADVAGLRAELVVRESAR